MLIFLIITLFYGHFRINISLYIKKYRKGILLGFPRLDRREAIDREVVVYKSLERAFSKLYNEVQCHAEAIIVSTTERTGEREGKETDNTENIMIERRRTRNETRVQGCRDVRRALCIDGNVTRQALS